MKRKLAAVMLLCVMLCGCARMFDGHYTSVKPHERPSYETENRDASAKNYEQLYEALEELVESGRKGGIINMDAYPSESIQADLEQVVTQITEQNPIAAYAVEGIQTEVGKSGGQIVVDVDITYSRNRAEILNIKTAADMAGAADQVREALKQIQTDLVLRVKNYEELDLIQIVERYALDYPQFVIEQPQVSANTYPQDGSDRVIELRFTYQTDRDSLRGMREQVEPVFESALLYVSGDGQEKEKYSQLYSFLMERYDYQIVGSITPAYSLLRHGVGDSRAFAAVYAAMCRQAGLECLVVSGTYNGESRYWNIVCEDGVYYHVNLLEDRFRQRTDGQMEGFVWDYSAYPACGKVQN